MDEYVELLVLSYFQNHPDEYSLGELRNIIGISFAQLDDIIDCMISEGKLLYRNENLELSFEGRMMLLNSSMEEYEYFSEVDINKYLLKECWSIDKPFYVSKFSKKKWRGSIKK